MQILVSGGTGFVGSYLCKELAGRGHSVTAIARNPPDEPQPSSITVVQADITNYDDLPEVIDGQDVVINLVSLSPLYHPKGGSRAHEAVTVSGTRNLVRAMEETGVERFIQMSALGADPDGPTAYIRAKGRADGIIRSSDLDWTIIQPSVIFGKGDEFIGFIKRVTTPGITVLPGADSAKFQPIWVHDLVPLIADIVTEDKHDYATLELGGPRVYTLREVTQLIYQQNPLPLTIIPLPVGLARIGFSLARPIPFIPFGPDQARSLQFENITQNNAISEFDIDPAALRTLEEYLGIEANAPE